MLIINVKIRNELGSNASRYLRRKNNIPAIIYGAKKKLPMAIQLNHDVISNLKKKYSLYETILILKINTHTIKAKIKTVQYHAFKSKIIHIDFARI